MSVCVSGRRPGRFWGLVPFAVVAAPLACGQTELKASSLRADDGSVMIDGGIGAGGLGAVPTPLEPYEPAPTLFTHEGELRDHCGEPIVLRGVAELIAWTPGRDGDPEFFEIAKTGANAVRIMWQQEEPAAALDAALTEAVAQGLIPVVELQESFRSGPEADALAESMEYWMAPAVVQVLKKHERALIVELASWASQSAPSSEWIELYSEAVSSFRGEDLRMPIAIVEPSWGPNSTSVASAMAELLGRDPVENLLVAFDFWSGNVPALERRFQAFDDQGVASYISEFSEYQIFNCPDGETDVSAVMATAANYGASWFAWSWGAVPNAGSCAGYLDMTTDGTVATLTDFGALVALEDPNGISRTATAVGTISESQCPL